MRPFLQFVLTFVAALYLLYQVRKPTKWVGRFFLWIMNASHSGVTDWGLEHVVIEKDFTILDVGCGGGRTIEKLAKLTPEGKTYGIDYANGSVAASRGKNARLIEAGRVEIKQASVSQLPFPDGMFDLVTAVETQYYWPNPVADMQEILRVLAPGGRLVVIAESYKTGKYNALQRPVMKLLKSTHFSRAEQEELFLTAGYKNVRVDEERKKGWICCVGAKANGTVVE
jgi:ubiquinone/menaquinone biosynthesis C-methylase UbiE